MIKLMTPLVVATTLAVILLGIARLLVIPESWPISLLGMLFLPLALSGLVWRARRKRPDQPIKAPATLRAALVGAGMVLAMAMLESMAEFKGLLTDEDGTLGTLLVLGPALIAAWADVLGARLEKKAAQEDRDSED